MGSIMDSRDEIDRYVDTYAKGGVIQIIEIYKKIIAGLEELKKRCLESDSPNSEYGANKVQEKIDKRRAEMEKLKEK